jgi:hypothetical protein
MCCSGFGLSAKGWLSSISSSIMPTFGARRSMWRAQRLGVCDLIHEHTSLWRRASGLLIVLALGPLLFTAGISIISQRCSSI